MVSNRFDPVVETFSVLPENIYEEDLLSSPDFNHILEGPTLSLNLIGSQVKK
jgi:hypothetical protein